MIKKYTTAQGTSLDIDNLRLVNETVIAVGNMSVNARGDLVAKDGSVKQTRNDIMKDTYRTLNVPLLRTGAAKPTTPPKHQTPVTNPQPVKPNPTIAPVASPAILETTGSLRGALANTVIPVTLDPDFDVIEEQQIIDSVAPDLGPNSQPPRLKRI